MTDGTPTGQLSAAGVSIWLDDLSRTRIDSGNLQTLIDEKNVVGVTTNPTIFAKALAESEAYADRVKRLALENASVADAVFSLTTDDVADACDVFLPVFDATGGVDGRVSIEVEPRFAHDASATTAEAKRLFATVNRPNVLIKIPATSAGLDAITATIAAGISVNVTLIFNLQRYREVIDAYLLGLEKALEAGIDVTRVHSVASFFVSRVDTEIDKRLVAVGTGEARALKGQAGVANARLAYEIFARAFEAERATRLLLAGANKQRPLWASTGVKDPDFPDTLYVTELVAADVVNTMPEKTLNATFEHGVVTGDTVTANYSDAKAVLDAIASQGISYDDVTSVLEVEGIDKFTESWNQLCAIVASALEASQ